VCSLTRIHCGLSSSGLAVSGAVVALCPTRQRLQLSNGRVVLELSGIGLETDGSDVGERQAASACVIGCTNKCITSSKSNQPRTLTTFPALTHYGSPHLAL